MGRRQKDRSQPRAPQPVLARQKCHNAHEDQRNDNPTLNQPKNRTQESIHNTQAYPAHHAAQ